MKWRFYHRIGAFRMFQYDLAAQIAVKGALPESTGFRKGRAYETSVLASYARNKGHECSRYEIIHVIWVSMKTIFFISPRGLHVTRLLAKDSGENLGRGVNPCDSQSNNTIDFVLLF